MEPMGLSILTFLLVGLIAGWLAGEFTRGTGFGLVGNIIVGVLGAFLGGWLASLLGITAYGILGALIVSFIGAVILLFLVNLVAGNRTTV
jgi:uncharacterized membrane protein YeaQ/YmgE (transglycosylase-associated protein family)